MEGCRTSAENCTALKKEIIVHLHTHYQCHPPHLLNTGNPNLPFGLVFFFFNLDLEKHRIVFLYFHWDLT